MSQYDLYIKKLKKFQSIEGKISHKKTTLKNDLDYKIQEAKDLHYLKYEKKI